MKVVFVKSNTFSFLFNTNYFFRHSDNDGPYYWHIKSGTIQREPPIWPKDRPKEIKTPIASTNPQQFLSSITRNTNNVNNFYGTKDNRVQVIMV